MPAPLTALSTALVGGGEERGWFGFANRRKIGTVRVGAAAAVDVVIVCGMTEGA